MNLLVQARAIAVTLIVALAFYVVFAVVGEPWGTLNDVANAVLAALIAQFVLSTRRVWHAPRWALAIGLAGAAVSVLGSVLVITHITGWFLAGLVSTLGFAGVGAWVLGVDRGRTRIGAAVGVLMACGVIALPGVLLRYDDFAKAPIWLQASFLAWLGTILFPVWAWRAAVSERRLHLPPDSGWTTAQEVG